MITLPELKAVVSKYMLLADPHIIKFLAGVAMANRIPSLTSTWVFLVGASSGGKSTLLEPFEKLSDSFFISDMTAKTLFSSMKGQQENAVIFHMPKTGGMVLITDFTLMLDKDEQTAKEIMSQFRLIYDGKFKKLAGNGGSNSWEGRFGFIAGVTSAVYTKQQQYAALGERMIYYTFEQPNRLDALELAYKNMDKTEQAKEEIGLAFAEYLNQTKVPESVVRFDDETVHNLKLLANMATLARSSVSRDKYQRNRMIQNDFNEMPMRMFKQLLNLGQGLVALNGDGKVGPDDQAILYKTALDSIPRPRLEVMKELTSYEKGDVSGVAAALGAEYDQIKMVVQDLAAKGIVTQQKGYSNGSFFYKLKPEFRELMSRFQHIEMTDKVLEKQEEVPAPEEPPILTEIEREAVSIFDN